MEKIQHSISGLLSLPDSVAISCLAQVSRFDLAALAVTSKSHRSLVVSPELDNTRHQMGYRKPCFYVCLHISHEPTPRWFIFHPMQRRLKPISWKPYEIPESSSCFVAEDWGIYVIGGLVNGNPTSDVLLLDCVEHTWYRQPSMKMARASASASLLNGKIYVFGGLGDKADSSNLVEVFDLKTRTWDLLFVFTPKMPLNIKQSVVIDGNTVYAVDEEDQIFAYSPTTTGMFLTYGKIDSGHRNDWCLMGDLLFCPDTYGRIMWCEPDELNWKKVKGLKELRDANTKVRYDITKLSTNSDGNIVIFWKQLQDDTDESLWELWSAEISFQRCNGCDVWGKIEWSGAVLDPFSHPNGVKVLYSASVYV